MFIKVPIKGIEEVFLAPIEIVLRDKIDFIKIRIIMDLDFAIIEKVFSKMEVDVEVSFVLTKGVIIPFEDAATIVAKHLDKKDFVEVFQKNLGEPL